MVRRKRGTLKLEEKTKTELEKISRNRNMPAVRVQRAKIVLLYHKGGTISSIACQMNTNRPLVERCLDKALEFGAMTALEDVPRCGRPTLITDDARNWVVSLACQRPVDLGYAAETWTYSALIKHIRGHCMVAGFECLKNIGKGLLNGILSKSNIKPHKISYYLEKRDPEFEEKMANVLHIYKEVAMINAKDIEVKKQTTLSYDEKPGIQAIKNIAAQLQPVPDKYPTVGRDYEYKRLGTLSLLAGIDLHTGRILPLVRERHRSREFIEFLRLVDQEYPDDWKIRLVLDNHSSHISKETRAYLKTKVNRFEFVFTPKHGSWLNMIEMFFSKISRGFLRHIRVECKQELKERILQGIEEVNQEPVVFKWKYKMDEVGIA